jgi:hypothetical protein
MSLFLCNVYRHTLYTHKSVLPSRIRARTLFRAATKTVDHRSVSDCGDICITANEVVPLRQSDAQWAAPAQYGCAAHPHHNVGTWTGGRHAICILGQCVVVQRNALLAYVCPVCVVDRPGHIIRPSAKSINAG